MSRLNKKYLQEVCEEYKDQIEEGLESAGGYELEEEELEDIPDLLEDYLVSQMVSNFQYDFGMNLDWERVFEKEDKDAEE